DSALATLPSGANVSQVASLDFLPDFLRAPVDLTLSSALPALPSGPYDPAVSVPASAVALTVGEGAAIQADAGAKISISVLGRKSFTPTGSSDAFTSRIVPQTAVAEVLGTITAPGGSIVLTANNNANIWLGADSKLDVSGVALTDPRQTLFHTGKV